MQLNGKVVGANWLAMEGVLTGGILSLGPMIRILSSSFWGTGKGNIHLFNTQSKPS